MRELSRVQSPSDEGVDAEAAGAMLQALMGAWQERWDARRRLVREALSPLAVRHWLLNALHLAAMPTTYPGSGVPLVFVEDDRDLTLRVSDELFTSGSNTARALALRD
jgi:hypothetical protein